MTSREERARKSILLSEHRVWLFDTHFSRRVNYRNCTCVNWFSASVMLARIRKYMKIFVWSDGKGVRVVEQFTAIYRKVCEMVQQILHRALLLDVNIIFMWDSDSRITGVMTSYMRRTFNIESYLEMTTNLYSYWIYHLHYIKVTTWRFAFRKIISSC